MSRTYLFKIALSLFLFSILFAGGVSAQTNSCAVKILIMRSGGDKDVTGAAATAVNSATKKSYKSVLKEGLPFFADLPEGNYRVTVTKAGYFRSADDRSLNCDSNSGWVIALYPGNPNRIVKLYNRPRYSPYKVQTTNVQTVRRLGSTDGFGDLNATVPPIPPPPVIGGVGDPKTVSGGVVNSKSTNLVKPAYPAAARAVRASGAVNVQVTIDETGKVISANAVSGHPLLRGAAEAAARASTFYPTLLSGRPVKVTGIIVYNFVAP